MLPGWFGFGSAVQGKDMGELKAMAEAWPFFKTLVQNMEMVMAKADMAIARRYAKLVPDAALAPLTRTAGILTVIAMAALGLGVDVHAFDPASPCRVGPDPPPPRPPRPAPGCAAATAMWSG